MAIINNGVKNDLADNQIPNGYTRPTITEFENPDYVRAVTINVLKDTVDDANPVTTMEQIINDATIGLNFQAEGIVTNDFVNTNNVEMYTVWSQLTNNIVDLTGKGNFLTDNPVNYVCTIVIYIKIT